MSMDKRYQAYLSDLLSLFQQLAIRCIKQKPIDLYKFKHYFNMFYDRMQQLETSFHQSKLKITMLLTRLSESCLAMHNQNVDEMHTLNHNSHDKQRSQQHAQSFIRSVSSKKRTDFSKQLGSIVEEDELLVNRVYNKRSQTAAGYRQYSNNGNRSQIRPKTGQTDPKRYANNMQTISKTISISVQETQKSEFRQPAYEGYMLDADQIVNNRRKFYEQLQRKKQIQAQPLSKQQVKWVYGGRKSKSGWSRRISRLL